jgi:hypothetical protein
VELLPRLGLEERPEEFKFLPEFDWKVLAKPPCESYLLSVYLESILLNL